MAVASLSYIMNCPECNGDLQERAGAADVRVRGVLLRCQNLPPLYCKQGHGPYVLVEDFEVLERYLALSLPFHLDFDQAIKSVAAARQKAQVTGEPAKPAAPGKKAPAAKVKKKK